MHHEIKIEMKQKYEIHVYFFIGFRMKHNKTKQKIVEWIKKLFK